MRLRQEFADEGYRDREAVGKGMEGECPKKTARAKLTSYDLAKDLGSDEAIAVFMAEAFQTNDVAYISHALGVVARAEGMAQIVSRTGLSREQLYRSFSEKGNPTLKTTLAVMKALGVQLTTKTEKAAWRSIVL